MIFEENGFWYFTDELGDRSRSFRSKKEATRHLRYYVRWLQWDGLNLIQFFFYKIFIAENE